MKKTLIVDDTKNIRLLLTTCLELNGYEVETACNGLQALEIIEKTTFNLIFLDIKLPELSGTEVLRRIRNLGINTPVVIMTAFATVKNAIDCTKLGAVAYLQKPFTADKVKLVLNDFNSLSIDKFDDTNPTSNGSSSCFNTLNSLDDYIKKSKDLIALGNFDEAFKFLKKALSLNPSHAETYMLISNIYKYKNDFVEAEKFYNISKILCMPPTPNAYE